MEKSQNNDPSIIKQKDTRDYKLQDNEGHMKGDNLSTFNEQQTQERQQAEDEAPLNRKDARDDARGTEQG